ncbi:MULE transposase [Candidatus Regiella insecticola 5.15]|uniref:MULE transposase n=1 Tax=Candidatus Regiella insecticola 5.15 TaxID=1005043 RepID=G2GYK1_9ENTR|nr:MULE transposase [Candidatus Regiella insecticola 5.15]
MFNLIKEAAIRIDLIFNPKCFQIDFEIGMIMAIKELFGHQTKIKGCLFHFGQSIWRKVQNVGLSEEYKNNAEVKLTVRRICALALVPIDTIDECWTTIHAQAPNNESKKKILMNIEYIKILK